MLLSKYRTICLPCFFSFLLTAGSAGCETAKAHQQDKQYEHALAAARKEDDRRLAEEKRRVEEKLRTQRKSEAAAKAAEDQRRREAALAAQRGAELETKRLAEEKRRAQEEVEAQRKAEAAAQAETRRLARLREEAERRQNEEAQRLEQQIAETWKAKQAAFARRQAQAAHQLERTKKEAEAEARTPPKRIIPARDVTQQVYLLQFGDELEISVWGHADLSVKSPIREDGTSSFPLIGQVEATGHSLKEVEEAIRDRLNRDYIVNPQVTARLTGAKFSVFGEVQQPGSFPIEGSMDLLSALSIAGGITKFGSGNVEIIRGRGEGKATIRANVDRIVHGKEPNVNILPHDTVYVKRRLF